MLSDNSFSPPPFRNVLLSFAIGLAVGLLVSFPTLQTVVAGINFGDSGPVGNVLLIGVFLVAVVVVGLFGIYRLFWRVDR